MEFNFFTLKLTSKNKNKKAFYEANKISTKSIKLLHKWFMQWRVLQWMLKYTNLLVFFSSYMDVKINTNTSTTNAETQVYPGSHILTRYAFKEHFLCIINVY